MKRLEKIYKRLEKRREGKARGRWILNHRNVNMSTFKFQPCAT
jgi:hypothetical protein